MPNHLSAISTSIDDECFSPLASRILYNQPVRHLFQTYSLRRVYIVAQLRLSKTTTPPPPLLSPLPTHPHPAISSSRRFASLLDSLDEIAMGFALSSIRGKRPYTRPSLRSRFNGDYNNPRDSWRGRTEGSFARKLIISLLLLR